MQSEINRVLKKLQKSDPQYTYLIFFFIAFSVFTIFIIRPSLITAFTLVQREKNLQDVNRQYEEAISQILSTQNDLERAQGQLHMADAAVPAGPRINAVLEDIKQAAQESNVTIDQLNINKTNLVYTNSSNNVQAIQIDVNLLTTFESYMKFQERLYKQKRIKNIVSTEFIHQQTQDVPVDETAPQSGNLKIQLEIVAYYL